MMPYNIGKYGDLYYFNQKDEKARQEQLEAILNVDKDELLEIAKEIDETLEKGGICIIGGKNQIDQCDPMKLFHYKRGIFNVREI